MHLALSAAAIGFAAILGGATGFGASLLSTPLLLLAGSSVPEVVLVNLSATLVTRLAVLYRLRREVDLRCAALLGAGAAPGAWLGAVTAGLIAPRYLKLAAGILVALAGLHLAVRTRAVARTLPAPLQAATGLLGGYLSTTTSLNGPPAAVLLARAQTSPATFVANLAGYFVVTNAVSLAVLGARGQLPHAVLWPALPLLIAAAVAGNRFGAWLGNRLPAKAFRGLVAVLVVAAGLVTAATGIGIIPER